MSNKDDECVLIVVAFHDKRCCVLNLVTQETIFQSNHLSEALEFTKAESQRLGGVKQTCVGETIYNLVIKPKGKPYNWVFKSKGKSLKNKSSDKRIAN